jgi:hypothetical protein
MLLDGGGSSAMAFGQSRRANFSRSWVRRMAACGDFAALGRRRRSLTSCTRELPCFEGWALKPTLSQESDRVRRKVVAFRQPRCSMLDFAVGNDGDAQSHSRFGGYCCRWFLGLRHAGRLCGRIGCRSLLPVRGGSAVPRLSPNWVP